MLLINLPSLTQSLTARWAPGLPCWWLGREITNRRVISSLSLNAIVAASLIVKVIAFRPLRWSRYSNRLWASFDARTMLLVRWLRNGFGHPYPSSVWTISRGTFIHLVFMAGFSSIPSQVVDHPTGCSDERAAICVCSI